LDTLLAALAVTAALIQLPPRAALAVPTQQKEPEEQAGQARQMLRFAALALPVDKARQALWLFIAAAAAAFPRLAGPVLVADPTAATAAARLQTPGQAAAAAAVKGPVALSAKLAAGPGNMCK
jgi:hypothetical protein